MESRTFQHPLTIGADFARNCDPSRFKKIISDQTERMARQMSADILAWYEDQRQQAGLAGNEHG